MTVKNEYPTHPRAAIGGVVIRNDHVLLVRRDKPPSKGEWAIPGGCVELGERLPAAVEREIMEETGIRVKADDIVHVFDDIRTDRTGRIRFHYVIVDLLAHYVEGEPKPGDDVADARWVSCDDIEALAINSNTMALLKKLGFVKKI